MYDRPDISHDREIPAELTDVLKEKRDTDRALIVQINAVSRDNTMTVQAFVRFDVAPRIGDMIEMENGIACQVTAAMHRLETIYDKADRPYTYAYYVIMATLINSEQLPKPRSARPPDPDGPKHEYDRGAG